MQKVIKLKLKLNSMNMTKLKVDHLKTTQGNSNQK